MTVEEGATMRAIQEEIKELARAHDSRTNGGGGRMIVDWNKETARREGYFQALLDVKNWFERHSAALKVFRMYNQKNIGMLLSEISKNADAFQKFGDDTEIFFEYEKGKVTKVYIKKEAEQ